MHYNYPSILRRYLSTLIDGLFVLSVFVLVSFIFQHESDEIILLRIFISFGVFFIYEPLCTSKFCTIGQKITGIRVRVLPGKTRISLHFAYIRIFFKFLLGWISFLSIPFTKGKRGIHDFAVKSIVIYAEE